MKIFTKEFKETLKIIFWSGETSLGVVWLMLILGFLLGWGLGK